LRGAKYYVQPQESLCSIKKRSPLASQQIKELHQDTARKNISHFYKAGQGAAGSGTYYF
jgi:hypothetical protein